MQKEEPEQHLYLNPDGDKNYLPPPGLKRIGSPFNLSSREHGPLEPFLALPRNQLYCSCKATPECPSRGELGQRCVA